MIPITVLMIARDSQKFIREAIDSILSQCFTDFEFLIINDGSTDNTLDIIENYNDQRIKIINSEHNYIDNLNYGIEISKGKYISRIDSDDIMHSSRLKIQYKRMEYNPDIDVCGTWGIFFDNNIALLPHKSHAGYREIENPIEKLLESNFLIHSSVMIRKSYLISNKIKYSSDFRHLEDYNLWFDIAKTGGKFYIEPQELTFIRRHPNQISELNRINMMRSVCMLKLSHIKSYLESNNHIKEYNLVSQLQEYSLSNSSMLEGATDYAIRIYKIVSNNTLHKSDYNDLILDDSDSTYLQPYSANNSIDINNKTRVSPMLPTDLINSDIYIKLKQKIAKGDIIKDNDPIWEELDIIISVCYPLLKEKLLSQSNNSLSINEYRTLILIKIGIAPIKIAALLGRTKSTIGSRRDSISKKLLGKIIGQRAIDNYIKSL